MRSSKETRKILYKGRNQGMGWDQVCCREMNCLMFSIWYTDVGNLSRQMVPKIQSMNWRKISWLPTFRCVMVPCAHTRTRTHARTHTERERWHCIVVQVFNSPPLRATLVHTFLLLPPPKKIMAAAMCLLYLMHFQPQKTRAHGPRPHRPSLSSKTIGAFNPACWNLPGSGSPIPNRSS